MCGCMMERAHRCSIKQITHMCTLPIMCTENVLVSNDWRTEREKTNCTADMRVERKKIDVFCPVSVAAVAIR